MQIKVKNSKGVVHNVQAEPDLKVSALKQKVCEVFENIDVQNIKLIFRGKLLVDDNTLESYEIKEDSLIVLMVTKTQTDARKQDEKDLDAHRALVNQITLRGYSQEEALARLRQHNWDIAQVMHAIDHEDSDHEHGSGEEEDFGDDMDGFGGIGDDPISLLLTDPRFKQMRDDIRTNPDKAKEYLETLKDSSPELYEILKRDQEALDEIVDAIHEGSDLGDPVQLDFDGMDDAQAQELLQGLAQGRLPIGLINQLRGNRAGVRVGGDGAEGGELPNIGEALSPEDETNIQTLVSMGPFTREQCIEAYIACNKNVEQAANLLLDGN